MTATPRPIFEIYVEDDRYAVPTLNLVAADDGAHACAIVERMLMENAHHLGAELCFEGRLIASFGSLAVARERVAPETSALSAAAALRPA